jgi:hypothetical protein
MLRCASSFVNATYEKVGLIPKASRALPPEPFTALSNNLEMRKSLDCRLVLLWIRKLLRKITNYGNGYSWSSSKREEHII